MLIKKTKRWVNSFKIRNIGEVPSPTEEPIDVEEAIGEWLIRYNFAIPISNNQKQENKNKTPPTTKKKPPEWVEKSLEYINNKENTLSDLISIIGQENVNNILDARDQAQVKNVTLKKLDSESLKNLENYFS